MAVPDMTPEPFFSHQGMCQSFLIYVMLQLLIIMGSCKPKFNHQFLVHLLYDQFYPDTVVLRQLLLWVTAFLLPAHYALNNDTVGSHDALCLRDCCIEIWWYADECSVLSLQHWRLIHSSFNEALSQKTLEFKGNLMFWGSEGWTKLVLPRFKLLNTTETTLLIYWGYESYDLCRVIGIILCLSN